MSSQPKPDDGAGVDRRPGATVTLLTQDQCGLCDQAKAVLRRIQNDPAVAVRVDVLEVDLASAEGSGSARTRASCSLLECCSTASLSRTAGSRNESCGARSPAGAPAWPLTQVPDCARSRDDERLLALQSQGGAAAGRPSGDRGRSLVPSGRA